MAVVCVPLYRHPISRSRRQGMRTRAGTAPCAAKLGGLVISLVEHRAAGAGCRHAYAAQKVSHLSVRPKFQSGNLVKSLLR